MTQTHTNKIWIILIAGAFATIAFDFFGQGLSPLFGFAKMAPVGLAGATVKAIFGATPKGVAEMVHLLTGFLVYSLGYVLVARPIQRMVMPSLPWFVTAFVYGVGLWVFGLYLVAHFIAGMAPFLGFHQITWVALVGHIVYAFVLVYFVEKTPYAKVDVQA